MSHQQSPKFAQIVSLVPKQFRKLITHGIFMVPASVLLPNYQAKKLAYLSQIKKTKQPSSNSMHKYTSVMPISAEDIQYINNICFEPLASYFSKYSTQYSFKNSKAEFHGGFAITYNQGHKGLSLHVDDSTYTVNICLKNESEGNEVVFSDNLTVQMIEDFACIHPGRVPHRTQELKKGQRVNIVLWYK